MYAPVPVITLYILQHFLAKHYIVIIPCNHYIYTIYCFGTTKKPIKGQRFAATEENKSARKRLEVFNLKAFNKQKMENIYLNYIAESNLRCYDS